VGSEGMVLDITVLVMGVMGLIEEPTYRTV
jgi:hypothetical protein